ncbi:14568_t:CDS:2, partial [Gigaspora margarita]
GLLVLLLKVVSVGLLEILSVSIEEFCKSLVESGFAKDWVGITVGWVEEVDVNISEEV